MKIRIVHEIQAAGFEWWYAERRFLGLFWSTIEGSGAQNAADAEKRARAAIDGPVRIVVKEFEL